ncbi:unnamed protein product [Mycena citricolor]|uniref:F-box domain-containing protein n=1 Tax=Mycena citricolor TaxID=2018698 RepID=A0AAD2HL78_9AGAR|nr:unnamed protein product [Mycena citricolor]
MKEDSAVMRFINMPIGPHDTLFSYMNTSELVALMATCGSFRKLILETYFDINLLLLPFFGSIAEVRRFRDMQAESGTIISGSMALQFFSRTRWPESDLDLYVEERSRHHPVRFLDACGYKHIARHRRDKFLEMFDDYSSGEATIIDVMDFKKGNKKIQLIIASSPPMRIIVLFHSTVVMNIITHAHAFSLYPRPTFIENKFFAIDTSFLPKKIHAARQKYVDRGWRMASKQEHAEVSDVARWIGDKFTWPIVLPPTPDSGKVSDMVSINSWNHWGTKTDYSIASDPHLRNKYILNRMDMWAFHWWIELHVLQCSESNCEQRMFDDSDLCQFLMKIRRPSVTPNLRLTESAPSMSDPDALAWQLRLSSL